MVGHLLRRVSQTKSFRESDVEAHIVGGRPRMGYIKQIMMDTGYDGYEELK